MPARSVKPVAKKRSNKKRVRPKQDSPENSGQSAPEIVESMTAVDTAPTPVQAGGRIVLGASCTIHEAPALRAHLLDRAAHPGPYEIDGREVQQIDTAGLQLVVAFALDCLERGIHYAWLGRSPSLDEAIRTLGVGALLESPGSATVYSAPGAA